MMGEKAAWLKNLRTNPRVTIRLGNSTFHGTAHEINDDVERRQAFEAYTETVTLTDYFDYMMYHWGFSTRSKIVRTHRRWFEDGIPVMIKLRSAE